MAKFEYGEEISQEFKDLPPKHKALVALRTLRDKYGFTNEVIAKALDYHPDYISSAGNRLKAVDFVGSSDIKEAFKTIKAFSKGETVNSIKPKDKTVLSAATELIKIGTDHNDHADNTGNLTLNISVLKGIDPKSIATGSLDDRLVIDSNETVIVEDICKEKACVVEDLYSGAEKVEEKEVEKGVDIGEDGLWPLE
jgi:hypothetical protein